MVTKSRKVELAQSVQESNWKATYKAIATEKGMLATCDADEFDEINDLLIVKLNSETGAE